jgi:hypothetical protein
VLLKINGTVSRAGSILGIVLLHLRKRMRTITVSLRLLLYAPYDRYFSKNGANKHRSNGNGANHREKQREQTPPTE